MGFSLLKIELTLLSLPAQERWNELVRLPWPVWSLDLPSLSSSSSWIDDVWSTPLPWEESSLLVMALG